MLFSNILAAVFQITFSLTLYLPFLATFILFLIQSLPKNLKCLYGTNIGFKTILQKKDTLLTRRTL